MDKWYYYKENGHLIRFKIEVDDEPLNPRKEQDNMGTLNLWWGRHAFGDNEGKGKPNEILDELIRENVPKEKYNAEEVEYEWTLNQKMVLLQSYMVLIPCFIYEHGRCTISCSNGYPYNDRFDAGMAGFIYVTKENYTKWTGKSDYGEEYRKTAREILVAEVSEYDMYLQGDCYGYKSEIYDVKTDEWEEDISCWGYLTDKYGDELVEMFRSELTREPLIDEEDALMIAEEMHKEYETMAQAETLYAI